MKLSALTLFTMIALLLGFVGCSSHSGVVVTRDIARIEPETLINRMDEPGVIIIDVRLPEDWEASQTKIKGARRESVENVADWAPKYPKDTTIVLY